MGQNTERQREIYVMSYNVLTTKKQPVSARENEGAKPRGELLFDLLYEYGADTIGLCEVSEDWYQYLKENLTLRNSENVQKDSPKYEMAGVRSTNGEVLQSGGREYVPILYRSDRYSVIEEGGCWYSETPEAFSKYSDVLNENGEVIHTGMKYERVYSYAVFKSLDDEKPAYIHINTHFDHKSGRYINIKCAQQLLEAAEALRKRFSCSVLISGDFNVTEQMETYQYLADSANGYVNVKYATDNRTDRSSFEGYGENYREKDSYVIDHIFVNKDDVHVKVYDVLVNPYISDHSCIYVGMYV